MLWLETLTVSLITCLKVFKILWFFGKIMKIDIGFVKKLNLFLILMKKFSSFALSKEKL